MGEKSCEVNMCVIVCLFLFVCVCLCRGRQPVGQRVSMAPCVAYELIKDNRGWGTYTLLPTFCECLGVVFRVRGRKKISWGPKRLVV